MSFGFDVEQMITFMNGYIAQFMDLVMLIAGIAIGGFALMKLKQFFS